MEYKYLTKGTCSRVINIEYDPETHRLKDVKFEGGCHGNLQGLGRLVEGQKMEEVIERLKGIRCREKPTSCPDQLACALQQILTTI